MGVNASSIPHLASFHWKVALSRVPTEGTLILLMSHGNVMNDANVSKLKSYLSPSELRSVTLRWVPYYSPNTNTSLTVLTVDSPGSSGKIFTHPKLWP